MGLAVDGTTNMELFNHGNCMVKWDYVVTRRQYVHIIQAETLLKLKFPMTSYDPKWPYIYCNIISE